MRMKYLHFRLRVITIWKEVVHYGEWCCQGDVWEDMAASHEGRSLMMEVRSDRLEMHVELADFINLQIALQKALCQ